MTAWSELITQLMLGTQGSPAPSGDFAGATPEQALLKQLALSGQKRRAGFVASNVKTLPQADPAPPETMPVCSHQAIWWLHTVLDKPQTRELAYDWFIHIKKRGKRVPLGTVAYLLDFAKRDPKWASYVLPVIGARGKWLIEKSDFYPKMRDELWLEANRSPLKPTEIHPNAKGLLQIHQQMMEVLARE